VNQKVAGRLLERLGFDVDAVANGAEAVRAVGESWYAAMLKDRQMTEIDVRAVTKAIHPRTAATVSATADIADLAER
jgi:two-component system, sensor histidine kinase and response regulator